MKVIDKRLCNVSDGQYLIYNDRTTLSKSKHMYICEVIGDSYHIIYELHVSINTISKIKKATYELNERQNPDTLTIDRPTVSKSFNALVFELSDDEYLLELAGLI